MKIHFLFFPNVILQGSAQVRKKPGHLHGALKFILDKGENSWGLLFVWWWEPISAQAKKTAIIRLYETRH